MKPQFSMILTGRHANGTRFDVVVAHVETHDETKDQNRFFLGTKVIDGIEFFWRVVGSEYAPIVRTIAVKDNGVPIASGDGYIACSKVADQTGLWDMKPGTCAPYNFMTPCSPWHPEIKKIMVGACAK